MLKKLRSAMRQFGFDPAVFSSGLRGAPHYWRNRGEMKRQFAASGKEFLMEVYPCLGDRFANSGTAAGAYFHQDLLVAQMIFEAQPRKHVDFGSRVDGFVAHVASFRPVEVFDIRPLSTSASNITFSQCDMMAPGFALSHYCDSMSCLHVLEHCGLGRYGDPLDYYGHLKAWDNLFQVLEPNGMFYFSVPIGRQRMAFDGHRVFSMKYLLDMIRGRYDVERFAYVDDQGCLHHTTLDDPGVSRSFGLYFGCGIFALRKRGAG